jgi:hypothetical protein
VVVARRDLSRTVIEGGRSNSHQRRASHGIARQRARAWLDQVQNDVEEAEETAPPRGPRVFKSFRDKLGPAKRWLGSQVGRPWSKVYAELCERFDTRTVAGRHVVHDHMLEWVWQGDVADRARGEFLVDRHGILRRDGFHGSLWQVRKQVLTWTRDRRAVKTFSGWWWFRRAPVGVPCEGRSRCVGQLHYYFDDRAYHGWRHVVDAPLSNADLKKLERLRPEVRELVVSELAWIRR